MSSPSHRAPPTRRATARAATTSNRSPDVGTQRDKKTRLWGNNPQQGSGTRSQTSSNHTQTNAAGLPWSTVQEMSRSASSFWEKKRSWRDHSSVAVCARNHSQTHLGHTCLGILFSYHPRMVRHRSLLSCLNHPIRRESSPPSLCHDLGCTQRPVETVRNHLSQVFPFFCCCRVAESAADRPESPEAGRKRNTVVDILIIFFWTILPAGLILC